MRAGQGHLSVCGSFPGEPSGCCRNKGPKGMKFKLILQRRKRARDIIQHLRSQTSQTQSLTSQKLKIYLLISLQEFQVFLVKFQFMSIMLSL